MNLELRYSSILIGFAIDAIWSDETGFAVFEPTNATLTNQEIPINVMDFIRFSIDWHVRLKGDLEHGVDEWDGFNDLIESEHWHMIDENGIVENIVCPAFIENEITWKKR